MNKLKEISGKFYQETEVVMLATNSKSQLHLVPKGEYDENFGILEKELLLFDNTPSSFGYPTQHLYFLSNEEIKEGDWCYHPEVSQEYSIVTKEGTKTGLHPTQGVFRWKSTTNPWYKKAKKIIATTDLSLKLPQPSSQFILKYIELYNAGTPIKWINVEFEEYATETTYNLGIDCSIPLFRLKVNSSNEITIKKVKDSYTREEVIRLCRSAHLHGEQGALNLHNQVFKQWVEENL